MRSGTRRSQIKLVLPQITYCPNCHEARMAHAVCLSCGTYRGREVIVKKEKTLVIDDTTVKEETENNLKRKSLINK